MSSDYTLAIINYSPDEWHLSGHPGSLDLGLDDLGDAVGVSPHQAHAGLRLVLVRVRLNGAAHQGAPLVSLQHDVEHVTGRVLHVKELRASSSEVHHGLACGAALQRLVGAVQLGISLLKQSTPELALGVRVDVDKLPIPGREVVVHHHVHPLAVLPELEVEHPGVLGAEALVQGHHPGPHPLVHGQVSHGGQQPAVTKLSLSSVNITFNIFF